MSSPFARRSAFDTSSYFVAPSGTPRLSARFSSPCRSESVRVVATRLHRTLSGGPFGLPLRTALVRLATLHSFCPSPAQDSPRGERPRGLGYRAARAVRAPVKTQRVTKPAREWRPTEPPGGSRLPKGLGALRPARRSLVSRPTARTQSATRSLLSYLDRKASENTYS